MTLQSRVVWRRRMEHGEVWPHRWHVLQKPTDIVAVDAGSSQLYLGIARGTRQCVEKFVSWLREPVTDLPATTTEDWDVDSQAEGVVSEGELLAALFLPYTRGPLFPNVPPVDSEELLQERRVVEDMVFVQLVLDRSRYDTLRDSLDGNWPDVTELVQFPDAIWVDYTQQARSEAKELYRQLLRESGAEEGEPYEEQ